MPQIPGVSSAFKRMGRLFRSSFHGRLYYTDTRLGPRLLLRQRCLTVRDATTSGLMHTYISDRKSGQLLSISV
jgi:hypothetical protein